MQTHSSQILISFKKHQNKSHINWVASILLTKENESIDTKENESIDTELQILVNLTNNQNMFHEKDPTDYHSKLF